MLGCCTLTSPQGTPPSPLLCGGCCHRLCFAGEAARPGQVNARPEGARHGPPLPQAGGAHDLQCPARDPQAGGTAQLPLQRTGSPPKSAESRPPSACSASSPSPAAPQAATMPSAHPGRSMHAHATVTVTAAAGLRSTYLGSFLPLPAFGTCGAGRTLEGVRGQCVTSGLPEAKRAAEHVGGTGLAGLWGCSQAFRTRPRASSSRKGQRAGLGKGRALRWPPFLQTQSGHGHCRPATDGSICWMIQFACSDFSKGLTQGKGAFSASWGSFFSHDSRH